MGTSSVSPESAQRLERLAARRGVQAGSAQPAGRRPSPRRRRSHAAKKSRVAALALSLAASGGLAAGFAAIESPTSSQVTAVGGVVAVVPAGSLTTQTTVGTVRNFSINAPSTQTIDSTSAPVSSVVNGDVYTNRWGPVQVQVTFGPDGSVTGVDALQVPFGNGTSDRINEIAVPVLNTESLVAQSASVDTVSGATYTSSDYRRSLQSAIDAARAAGITQIA